MSLLLVSGSLVTELGQLPRILEGIGGFSTTDRALQRKYTVGKSPPRFYLFSKWQNDPYLVLPPQYFIKYLSPKVELVVITSRDRLPQVLLRDYAQHRLSS